MMDLVYSYLSHSPFEVKRGPFNRVTNVAALIHYRDKNKYNKDWVYCGSTGPFRSLGEKRIKEIVQDPSPIDPVLRLNQAITDLFSSWYEAIRTFMKEKQKIE